MKSPWKRRLTTVLCRVLLVLLGAQLFWSCASPDYRALSDYYAVEPKTICVLPARNMTTDAEAPLFYMATIGQPLVYRGYYVMPTPLVADILAREGIDLDGESWTVDPHSMREHFGADALLYVTIEEWDTVYNVLSSSVNVTLDYTLVDTASGETIWTARGTRRVQGGNATSSGNFLADLVVGAIDAAVTAATTDYVPLASELNTEILQSLPPGVYHTDHERLQKEITAWRQESQANQ